MDRSSQRRLKVLVFVAGASTLATEMAGARLLAPYFGTSNVVWANVIGLTLIYLSVGYWFGGRVADRRPTERALGTLILGAAVAIAALPFATRPLFDLAATAFASVSAGAYVGSFMATMLMFGIPITALGAVAPWAIRLSVVDIATAGSISGRLYALSTIGSIVGTFIPVLLLIPAIGTRRTMILIAAVLALSALPLVRNRAAVLVPAALLALLALPPGSVKSSEAGRVLFEGESSYQYVQVVERTDGSRILHLNEGWGVHSILPTGGSDKLTNGYWDAFLAVPALRDEPFRSVAVLGNAAGTVSNLFAAAFPAVDVAGVEIDALVSRVGRKYFAMNSPRLTIHTADARPWLAASNDRYDMIVVDAFRQPYIPFHLVTEEVFTQARDHLTPDGVVAINVATPPEEQEVARRIEQTMAAVFPTVVSARYDSFNTIVVGFAEAKDPEALVSRLESVARPLDGPARTLAATLVGVTPGLQPPLTDDHAPLEWMTDRALLHYLQNGAPGS